MSINKYFSKRLKELRLSKGLNQPQLATELNMSVKTLGSWETGFRIPTVDTLCELASYFHVSLDYLTGYDYLSSNHNDEESATLETAM